MLTDLLVRLNIYRLSALDLGIQYNVSGYSVEDWIHDIRGKIDLLSRKEKENNLKKMEARLTQLLSEDKKVELEIEEMTKILN